MFFLRSNAPVQGFTQADLARQGLVQQLQREESIAEATPPIGVKQVLSMLLDGFFAQIR